MKMEAGKSRETQQTPEERVSRKEIITYGIGGITGTMPHQFRMQFGMSFMTDVAEIPIGMVGFWNMVLSLWDAVNDPAIGYLVDCTNTRWGKYRPHMVMGALCWAVTILLLFHVPAVEGWGRMLYYIIVMLFFSVFFTQFTIPWQALNSELSHDVYQRNLLLTSRQLVGAFSTSVVGVFTIPVVKHFQDVRRGWLAAAMIVAVSCVICAFVAVAGAARVDRSRPAKHCRNDVGQSLKQVLCNRAVICASCLLGVVNLGILLNAAISMYYLKYVVKNVDLLTVISVIRVAATLGVMPFLPLLLRKFGKCKVLMTGMWLQAACAVWLLVVKEQAAGWEVVAMSTLSTLGLTCANTCGFALIPDCTDYTELHFGRAQAGLINSVGTFVRKFGGAFSGLIVGGLMALAGYDGQTVANDAACEMILNIKIWGPIAIALMALFLVMQYPITANYAAHMYVQLKEMRAGKRKAEGMR